MLAATHPAAALTARRRRADRAGLGRCAVRASAETDAAELASLSANKEGLAKHLAAAQERSTVPVDLEASKSAVVDTTALPEGALLSLTAPLWHHHWSSLSGQGHLLPVVGRSGRRARGGGLLYGCVEIPRGTAQRRVPPYPPSCTDWCGPCKLIAPKLVAWNAELQPKVQFIKFKCAPSSSPALELTPPHQLQQGEQGAGQGAQHPRGAHLPPIPQQPAAGSPDGREGGGASRAYRAAYVISRAEGGDSRGRLPAACSCTG